MASSDNFEAANIYYESLGRECAENCWKNANYVSVKQ